MNYLAHIFLSGTEDEILLGNFMGDYVKGRKYLDYPSKVRTGLVLHRRIDAFTDVHPIVQQSKKYLMPKYRKYAGVIVDIFYDHFLIKNWGLYCSQPLDEFKPELFEKLMKHYERFPERVQFFIPAFIKNDWIKTYSTEEGIFLVLQRMAMRSSLPDESEFGKEILRKYYIQFDSEFRTFFPELIEYVRSNFEVQLQLSKSYPNK